MKHSKYYKELGATAACTKIMMEETKGIGKKSIKGWTKDCLLFDSWFASKKAVEAAMEVGAEFIVTMNKIPKDSARRPLRILQRIGLEVPTSCRGASIWYSGTGRLLLSSTSIMRRRFYL